MGRVSRHKKLKACDPFYRGPRKDLSKKLIAFPIEEDHVLEEQKIPRAAKEIMRNLAQAKFKEHRRSGKKMVAKLKPALKFQRNVGESKKEYLNRIDQEATKAIAHSMKESRELRQSRKRHLKKRREKLKEKKKEMSCVNDQDSVVLADQVRFGEVVQQPPMITSKPRKAQKTQGSKSLLLNSLMKNESTSSRISSDSKQNEHVIDSKSVLKTKKRKHMTPREKTALDEERERAIAAYRFAKGYKKQKLLPVASAVG